MNCHKSIIIVASGPSAAGFVAPPDIPVISVNGSINWLNRADYWFTLDPSQANMELMNNPRPLVKYFCACPGYFNIPRHVHRMERIAGTGRWSSHFGLQDAPNSISTGNSSYGALGLARHMGAKKVYLVGVDATNEPKVDGTLSKDLSHLPELFDSAVGGHMKIASAKQFSPRIPQMDYDAALEWLRND